MKVKVVVTCVGIMPLYMDFRWIDFWNERFAEALSDPSADAARRLFINEQGNVSLPACAIQGALKVALSNGQKTKELGDYLIVEEQPCELRNSVGSDAASWEPQVLTGDTLRMKDIVAAVVPRINDWSFQVAGEYDDKQVERSDLIAAFQKAGQGRGFGFCSPYNGSGRNGRFDITNWAETTPSER